MSESFFEYLKEQLEAVEKNIAEAKKIIAFSRDVGVPLVTQEAELRRLELQAENLKKALKKYLPAK